MHQATAAAESVCQSGSEPRPGIERVEFAEELRRCCETSAASVWWSQKSRSLIAAYRDLFENVCGPFRRVWEGRRRMGFRFRASG